MVASKIEWCDRSDWNPVRGCTRVSPGCGGANHQGGCYAEKIAARFSGPGQPFEGFAKRDKHGGHWSGKVEVMWDRLTDPLGWRTPARIFALSMSDLFHEALPAEEIATVFAVAVAAVHLRHHTIMILTKRTARMRELLNTEAFWEQVNAEAGGHVMERTDPLDRHQGDARATLGEYGPDAPPPGVWLGTSVEDQLRANERLPELLATPAAVRFVSFEPLLGPVDLSRFHIGWSACSECGQCHDPNEEYPLGSDRDCIECGAEDSVEIAGHHLHQAIIGGESGPRRRVVDLDWMRSLNDQCARARIAIFNKQVDKVIPLPPDLQRREFPTINHGASR